MKIKLLVLCSIILLAFNANAQTISMIGSTSPSGSWGVDTDMITTDGITYTLSNVSLTTATDPNTTGLKFRQDHDWAINWGNAAFPSGTASLNGANILTQAGTYDVTFNRVTGAYSFSGTQTVIHSIALVGTAAGGWPIDPQIDANTLTTTNGINYYSNSITLTTGACKFRQDNSWSTSWGGITFPSGPQIGNESNDIVVPTAGNYRVNFNRNTGAYTFDFPAISIVGEAVGGWPGDPGNLGPIDTHQLTTSDGETYTLNNLAVTTAITGGGAKFRQDNSWNTSWGNEAFPSATSSNGNNILTQAGTYNVTFTRSTGAYTFTTVLNTTTHQKTLCRIYPNPTNNEWVITSPIENIISVTLSNVLGKTISLTTPNFTSTTLEASSYEKGVYFITVETASAKETIKVIKL
jgi:hypothetical protein